MRERPIVTPGFIIGLLALSAGVLLLLDRQGLIDAGYIMQFFFPGLLLAAGLFRLAQPCHGPGRVWGGILTAAGIVMILDRLGYAHFGFRDLWPVFLIAMGVALLHRAVAFHGGKPVSQRSLNAINAWAAFGGGQIRSDTQDFQGGEVLAVFGGYEIDLRKAAIKDQEAVLYANAIFGGVEIKVPESWIVLAHGAPILGGYSDHTHKPDVTPGAFAQRLIIRGVAIFGGVDIKN